MATALKIAEPKSSLSRTKKHDEKWNVILDAVRPLYNVKGIRNGDGFYYGRLRDAIVRAFPDGLPIRDAISLHKRLLTDINARHCPFADDSVEDHANYAGREACIWFIATNEPRDLKEAQARVKFVQTELESDGETISDDLLPLAIASMGKDISRFAAREKVATADPEFKLTKKDAA